MGHAVADLARHGRPGARSQHARRRGRAPRPRHAIDDAKEEYPEIEGKSLIFAYLTTTDLSTIGIYSPQDPRVSLMHDLGMVNAPIVEKSIKPGAVLRHGLRRAGRRPGVRRAPHLRREPRATCRPSPTTAARPDPGHRARARVRRGGQARRPRGHQPDAAVDPVRHRALRARTSPAGASTGCPMTVLETASARHATAGTDADQHRGVRSSSPRCWSCRCSSVLVGSTTDLAERRLRLGRPGPRRSRRPGSRAPASALAVGAALGLAGACMQGLTRNPLADPGHPRHQRRRRLRDGAGDLGLRRLRPLGVHLVRVRRRGGGRGGWCTRSPRSAATARRRSSWRSPAPR